MHLTCVTLNKIAFGFSYFRSRKRDRFRFCSINCRGDRFLIRRWNDLNVTARSNTIAISTINFDGRWSARVIRSIANTVTALYRCPLRTNGRENTHLSAWVDPTVTMGLYTMMERLSESGRSHCRNRHVTNSCPCYQCYWLPIRISPPPSAPARPIRPFFPSSSRLLVHF